MKRILLFFVAITTVALTSCKKDNEEPTIIGTWKWEKVVDKEDSKDYFFERPNYIQINNDYTFTSYFLTDDGSEVRFKYSGTYTFANGILSFDDWVEEGFKNGPIIFKGANTIEFSQEGQSGYLGVLNRVSGEEANKLPTLPVQERD